MSPIPTNFGSTLMPPPGRARSSTGYDITDDQSPDWHRFKADAAARGFDAHLQVWHRGDFGELGDVFLRRRTDGIVVPIDTMMIQAHGTGVWDVLDGWFDTYARAIHRAKTAPTRSREGVHEKGGHTSSNTAVSDLTVSDVLFKPGAGTVQLAPEPVATSH